MYFYDDGTPADRSCPICGGLNCVTFREDYWKCERCSTLFDCDEIEDYYDGDEYIMPLICLEDDGLVMIEGRSPQASEANRNMGIDDQFL